MFFRRRKAKGGIQEPVNDVKDAVGKAEESVLFFLTERKMPGLYEYARAYGINIKNIFNNIEDAEVGMVIEEKPTRLVVIESGLGKFIRTANRKDLANLMGLSAGNDDKKITIFYTDSVLLSDARKVMGRRYKELSCHKYRGTIEVIRELLKLGENYIEGAQGDQENLEYALRFKGVHVEVEKSKIELGVGDCLLDGMRSAEGYQGLPAYNVDL